MPLCIKGLSDITKPLVDGLSKKIFTSEYTYVINAIEISEMLYLGVSKPLYTYPAMRDKNTSNRGWKMSK